MADTDPTLMDASCPSADELREFVAGRLGSQRTDEVALHLEHCTACQATLESFDDAEASIDAVVTPGGGLQFAGEPHCGRAVDAAARDSSSAGHTIIAPQRVGEFELLEPLGEGGMGTVYKARHASLGTTYAVKLLHPRRQADLATIERFQREMVALGRLDHPNIVRAVDAGEEAGVHYLVMEYIDGVDLGRALQSRGPMSIANACEAARQAAKGLAYVHQQGRVHRDVKPSNLMVASDGTVKLLDLGLARVEEYALDEPDGATDDILGGGSTVELTRTHQVMGTLEYMSPEQASNSKTVDEKADLYSLGCTLYKMLTGRSPFASEKSVTAMSQLLAHVEKPAPPVREHRPDVPDGLAKLLEQLLAKNPDERPQSADEVAMALAPFAAGSDLAKLSHLDHPQTERDTGSGSSKTVVLPRSDAHIEPKRSRLPWGPILLGLAGLFVLLLCPVGLAITAFLLRPDNGPDVVVTTAPTVQRTVTEEQLPVNDLLLPESGVEGQPVDLLALFDPQRDVRGNDWQLVDGALVSQVATPSMLQFPYRPSDHYRWEATVQRLESSESLEIGLVADGQPLIILVDGYPGAGPYTGIYRLDGQNVTQHRENIHRGQVLPFGRRVRLTAWVRHQGGLVHVRLEADGTELFSWRGRAHRARGTGHFPPTEAGVLFLGNWTASLRVSDVQVTPLTGTGEVVEFVDPVENIELAAAQRAVWKGGLVTLTDDREVTTLNDLTSQVQIREIDMRGSAWLNDEDLLYFAGLIDLERLDLSGTAVTNEGLRLLGPLPALADLSLAETGVSRDDAQLADDYPSLERLNLAATGIGTETLAAVSELSGLTHLDVSATRVSDDALAHLSGLDRLRSLNLTHTAVSDAGLEQLPALPELEQLSLSGTRVREAAPITVERFPSLARVHLLETDVSADAVTRLREALGEDADVATGTEPTNLLSLIDPQRDGYEGNWERAADGESLLIPSHNPARLAMPITLPEEFDLEVVAINNDGGRIHGPVFGLPLPNGGRPLVGFDHWPGDPNGPWTILHGIDGRMERESPAKLSRDVFTDESPVRLTIRIRNDGVWVEREGELLLVWQGDVSRLSPVQAWFTPDLQRPTIGLFNTHYTIPEMTLTPVTGRIGLPSFRPTYGVPDRSVAEWVLAHGGSVQVRYSDADPTAPQIRAGHPLPERPFWVTRINVEDASLPPEWLEQVGTLSRLNQFNVFGTNFENADLAPLGDVKTLEIATFDRTPLDDSGMQVLSRLPNLRILWAGHTGITAGGIGHFRGHPSLATLGAAIPSLSDDAFEAASTIPNLVQLSLWGSRVTGEGLVHFQGRESLRRLFLGRTDAFDPEHIGLLTGIPNLTTLQLTGNGLGPEAAAQLGQLRQLSDLRVSENPLGDEGVSRLASLQNLTELNMAGVGATNASLEALRDLNNLQVLDISSNPGITDAGIPALLVHQNLSELSLGGTRISTRGIRQLQNELPRCQIVTGGAGSAGRTIDLSQRGVTDETLPLAVQGVPPTVLILEGPGITDTSMPLVASLPGLQRLKLDRTKVTNDGLAELASSDALTRLELWNMPQITEPATAQIAAVPNLNQLVLKSTGIHGPGLERLHDKGLRGFYIGNKQLDRDMLEQYILPFGTLNTLDLAGTAITDEDVSLLLQMNLTNTLHLGWNHNITGPGLVHIADMPGVTRLNLDASGVTDEGLENLREAVQLERLIVRQTALSDESVETIAGLPNLNQVWLSDTNFTSEGLARLRELLPGATITADHLEAPDGYPPPGAELIVDGGWKPTFSADGGELAYGLPQGMGLEIINLETRERRVVTEDGKDAAWSPRGDWIAFAREPFHNSNREEIRIIRPDGSEERKVADGLYPFWIDGGQTLVFYSRDTSGLLSIDVDQPDAQPREFRARAPSYYCDATQDGAYLAWGYGGAIEVVERSSGQVVFEHQFAGTSTGLPSFSPDGRYLAYSPFGGDDRGVWVFDWRSGTAVRLNESNYWSPAWSPDGSRLVFDYRAPGTDTRETSVWMMDLAGRLPESDDE
jgi:serine/threonine protein kinase/Leucine-rich repeat (LRR) protein